ncbi:MAG: DUF2147 domain-containing protein [Methylophilaceae bacterium]|nr:DUF2147 domain-containing protein [Methylophilaceae bacterium]
MLIREIRILKKFKLLAYALLGVLACCATVHAAPVKEQSLDGYWLQIDDHDGRPLSIIRVSSQSTQLSGRIEEIFLPPGMQEPVCTKCPGARAGKRIRGMEILTASPSGTNEWHGRIFDPVSGKNYRCKLELAKDGNILMVRGYIGVAIFGRTQLWRRFGALK